ncbi:MAG TPA: hypothetical protein EYM25_07785 [Deltaproteobacteria bacterium]|nr:hypothetical protein [Deltaproteobacteria bacterium]
MHFPYSRLCSQASVGLVLALAISLFGESALLPPPLHAQSIAELDEKARRLERERKQFVKELETLLSAAKDSGFSEEELKAITINQKGKTIVVWEYLEQERIREKLRKARKFKPRDRYLTVLDVTNELKSRERLQLDDLRERTVFTGAEEQ